MTATTSPLSDVSPKVLQLQVITLIWMSLEAILSLGTAWTSQTDLRCWLAAGGALLNCFCLTLCCCVLVHVRWGRASSDRRRGSFLTGSAAVSCGCLFS